MFERFKALRTVEFSRLRVFLSGLCSDVETYYDAPAVIRETLWTTLILFWKNFRIQKLYRTAIEKVQYIGQRLFVALAENLDSGVAAMRQQDSIVESA